jgi:hypothetical protein
MPIPQLPSAHNCHLRLPSATTISANSHHIAAISISAHGHQPSAHIGHLHLRICAHGHPTTTIRPQLPSASTPNCHPDLLKTAICIYHLQLPSPLTAIHTHNCHLRSRPSDNCHLPTTAICLHGHPINAISISAIHTYLRRLKRNTQEFRIKFKNYSVFFYTSFVLW